MSAAGGPNDDLVKRLRQAMAELERRLLAGEPCRAEIFFKADPALAADPSSALDLIFHEYIVRGALGQKPTREEYYHQYPQWRIELEGLPPPDPPSDEPPFKMRIEDGPEIRTELYRIIEEIGDGPMGKISKAVHLNSERVVALKRFSYGDARDVNRFRTGAHEQAGLKHANIIEVYDVGVEEDDRPCFSMEYAEGGNLRQQIKGKPQSAEKAAQMVRTLAEAMSYAHGQGVIHRDLKPANVVLAADGTPKITDFGLAKRMEVSIGPTQSREILGTAEYMPPEQAAGQVEKIGPLSDVYSLGATLYELLTGRPPFHGETLLDTLQQVLTRLPVRPRRVAPGVPRALESICLMCLEKKQGRRYKSAQDLADDLGKWVNGKRPVAHGMLARVARTVRRRAVASAISLVVVLSSITLPLVLYLTSPDRERDRIEGQLAIKKPVTLLGPWGPLKWGIWATHNETQKDLWTPDGPFRIESPEALALKEIVHDPKNDRYAFSAWVRHDESFGDGRVGIYFAYSNHDTLGGQGREDFFCAVTFNGLADVRKLHPNLEGNEVALCVMRHVESTSNHLVTPVSKLFVPISWEAVGIWLKITVDISPEKIRFTVWRETQTGWEKQFQDVGRNEIESAKNELFPLQDRPELVPRSPLGLYVYRGLASFKNVVVTPYVDPESIVKGSEP